MTVQGPSRARVSRRDSSQADGDVHRIDRHHVGPTVKGEHIKHGRVVLDRVSTNARSHTLHSEPQKLNQSIHG
jgi:hypothetical protein